MVELTVIEGEQDALLKIDPKTKKGKPAQVEAGKTQYLVESAGGEAVEMAPDELSAKVITGAVGDITGQIKADADLGEGIVPIVVPFIIHVVSALADNLDATGEAVDKVVV